MYTRRALAGPQTNFTTKCRGNFSFDECRNGGFSLSELQSSRDDYSLFLRTNRASVRRLIRLLRCTDWFNWCPMCNVHSRRPRGDSLFFRRTAVIESEIAPPSKNSKTLRSDRPAYIRPMVLMMRNQFQRCDCDCILSKVAEKCPRRTPYAVGDFLASNTCSISVRCTRAADRWFYQRRTCAQVCSNAQLDKIQNKI